MHEDRIRILNGRLPTKRAIGHGLIRDEADRVLLCELTYKPAWDLPGGVVEPGESPRLGCRREVREELGLDLPVRALAAVNWMPPWRGWDDATTFLFDLGRHEADLTDRMRLEDGEIAAVHWCTPGQIEQFAAAATARLLDQLRRSRAAWPLYLEDGADAWVAGTGAASADRR